MAAPVPEVEALVQELPGGPVVHARVFAKLNELRFLQVHEIVDLPNRSVVLR